MTSLHGLLNAIDRWDGFSGLVDRLRRGESVAVAPAEGAKPYLVAALQERLRVPILVVSSRSGKARDLQEQIAAWSGQPERVLLFEEPDSLPYERMPADPNATAARLAAMAALSAGVGEWGSEGVRERTQSSVLSPQSSVSHSPTLPLPHSSVVVASARAMMERIMSPEQLRRSAATLRVGQRLSLDATLKRWVEMGYEPEAVVETPGSFSRRGGILDIYPPGSPHPFRVELFGDEIDSIRTFDPATQRSVERIQEIQVAPPHELLPPADEATRSRLRALDLANLTPQARDSFAREVERLSQGQSVDDIGFYRGFLAQGSLLDHLPRGGLVVLDDPAQIEATCTDLTEQALQLQVQALERGELPPGLPHALLEWAELKKLMQARQWARLEVRYDPEAEELPFAAPASYGGKLKLVLEDALAQVSGFGFRVSGDGEHQSSVVSHQSNVHPSLSIRDPGLADTRHPKPETVVLASRQTERLADLLAEGGHPITPIHGLTELPLAGLYLVNGALAHGWASEELGVVVLSDAEIFGWTKAHRVVRRRSVPREAFLSDLVEGDLAVHVEHGIGRFVGLHRTPTVDGSREFMLLEYGGGDRLYVPVDQADRISRYIGSGEAAPNLSRLGTTDWERAKERVRKSVRNVARELLAVYSARQAQEGYAFSHDTPWQSEMEASFPYVETPDQVESIRQVKADMEATRPMDRLICGDVGYGKTEVAIRAAFKAVTDGKQVAVLVPTTVLAQQHYSTFQERLQAFPVKVEVLSRFRSDKEQRQVVEGLRTGAVDICIGTHRIVQKDVEFKDLGLVIVDEEQRFGVMHKERLKQLRQQVDVLTLSATPIPRTLHMSLAGIRDMSTMETAPEDRLPIRTFVAEFTDSMVREALLREMDRGGQVYFVHNRVQNIHYIAGQIQKLVPDARIVVGHGQMPEEALERVMLEFAAGDHDILVCTTIIESGLDIPNVNTIIVNNADRFGLAQLYQLRGRVGRGANRAYAYFLYSKNKQLGEIAEKRLKTIFENTELGSGFRIAMKDLEIRGAGNLLGVEQHGQVNAVGFDLYTRLLAEAVADLQGKPKQPAEPQVSIELPVVAHLPESYVSDESARLSLYQRLAVIKKEEDLGGLVEELQDRFGPLPDEAQNLLFGINLKLVAGRIGVKAISLMEGDLVVRLDNIPLSVRSDIGRRFGPKVKVLPNQVRIPRSPNLEWMPLLQDVMDYLEEKAKAALAGVAVS